MQRLFGQANLTLDDRVGAVTGLVSGSRYGCSIVYDMHRRLRESGPRGVDAVGFAQATHNYPISACAIEFGLKGPLAALVSSPAAGMEALVCASDWLREGRCKRVIVAAYEDFDGMVTEHLKLARNGAGAMREAMALICMETADVAAARQAPVLAELRGTMITPARTGRTEIGDRARRMFGDDVAAYGNRIAGIEGDIGICLGATGLAELALSLMPGAQDSADRDWLVGAVDSGTGGAIAAIRLLPAQQEIYA